MKVTVIWNEEAGSDKYLEDRFKDLHDEKLSTRLFIVGASNLIYILNRIEKEDFDIFTEEGVMEQSDPLRKKPLNLTGYCE